ncbi:CIA30 family protein [Dokdonella sp.]|uniref:CIA30 family protein n=1 Tax=Dokdonella sp. TaxID=2291710 RepID=UPI003C69C9DB
MKYRTEAISILAVVGVLVIAVLSRQGQEVQPARTSESRDVAVNSFAIRNVRVFDGERTIDRANVVVRDGLTVDYGPDAPIAADLKVIDGIGRTLMPGLIDAHAHSWGDAQRDALRFGVTTEIDMHGDPARLPSVRRQRESLEKVEQADLLAAGAAATVAGGHGTQYGLSFSVLDPKGEVDAFVKEKIDQGSDFIKLIVEDLSAYSTEQRLPTLNTAQISQIIVATHANKRLAVAHVSRQRSAIEVVEANVDGLVHVFADAPISDAFIDLARKHQIFIVPTLSVVSRVPAPGDADSLVADSRISSKLSAGQLASLKAKFPASDAASSSQTMAIDNVRLLHAAGIPILAGTDAGNPGTAHGASLHGELELLVHAGLSPEQALRAATFLPAQRFAMSDRGRIAAGLRADLILVQGNPTSDIRDTRAIERIWKNGYLLDHLAPDQSIASAETVMGGNRKISDFDGGSITSRFGIGWQPSTDRLMGGSSTASMTLISGGANGTAGALEIRGRIDRGFAFPWAGVVFFPASERMQPVDLSASREIVFLARGDGREYSVLLLSGMNEQGRPSMQSFVAGAEWKEIRIPLADFTEADTSMIRGIAVSAGSPVGEFRLEVDEVELR